MQISSHTTLESAGRAAAAAAPPLPDLSPTIDPVVAQQARFRVEGAGPLASRSIVPATPGAHQIVGQGAATTDAIRGVLRVIEHAAGGPSASSSIQLDGVALADSAGGHGANTYRSHMDGDATLRASLERLRGPARSQQHARWAAHSVESTAATQANVVGGWLNLGPSVSGALLAGVGTVVSGFNERVDEEQLAGAIRVLRHEAQHIVDPTQPQLSPTAALSLREGIAEAHSTTVGPLRQTRGILGLDALVSDQALERSLATRPYSQVEQLLARTVRLAGFDPTSDEARQLVRLPAREVGERLVLGLATQNRVSPAAAREQLDQAFVAAVSGHAHV